MSNRQHASAERQRSHSRGQQNIRRRCLCGRIIVGNAAWWSHLSVNRPGCGFGWRA